MPHYREVVEMCYEAAIGRVWVILRMGRYGSLCALLRIRDRLAALHVPTRQLHSPLAPCIGAFFCQAAQADRRAAIALYSPAMRQFLFVFSHSTRLDLESD